MYELKVEALRLKAEGNLASHTHVRIESADILSFTARHWLSLLTRMYELKECRACHFPPCDCTSLLTRMYELKESSKIFQQSHFYLASHTHVRIERKKV